MTVWEGTNRLIDAARTLDGLRAHGLHLLAARRWRQQHQPVPGELHDDEREAVMVDLAMVPLLARIRATLDGPILVVKGPEVAARYPVPGLRPFRDLDLLVPNAAGARRVLLAAGFVSAGSEQRFAKIHHQAPLFWPELPLAVELHDAFKAPRWTTLPPNAELFANAIQSRVGVTGVLTLPELYHPVLLAAHSWRHVPLRRVLDLVDVAVMAEGLDAGELEGVARRLNIESVWRTTVEVIDALLLNEPVHPWPLRLWARHLMEVERQSIRRQRFSEWVGTFWSPSRTAPAGAAYRFIRGEAARMTRRYWAMDRFPGN